MRSVPLHDVNEIQETLSRANLDAIVVISPLVWCLTGYPMSFGRRPGYRRNPCAIVYPNAEPTLVIGRFQEEITLIRSWARDVTTYSDYVESPLARAAEVLQHRGLASRRIGVESRFLTVEFAEDLINGLDKEAEIVPCDDLLDTVWASKKPAEIEVMKENLENLSKAVVAALEQSRAGETEETVHKRILATIRQAGVASAQGRVVSGERVSLSNALSGERVLSQGDLVRIEYSCLSRTYPARVGRMGVVGQPSDTQRATYERYIQAVQSATAHIRPNQSGCEIFHSMREALTEAGLQPVGSSAGRALGIDFRERPILQAQEDFRTRPNTILCVGLAIAEGYKVSQEVQITTQGSFILPSPFSLEQLSVISD